MQFRIFQIKLIPHKFSVPPLHDFLDPWIMKTFLCIFDYSTHTCSEMSDELVPKYTRHTTGRKSSSHLVHTHFSPFVVYFNFQFLPAKIYIFLNIKMFLRQRHEQNHKTSDMACTLACTLKHSVRTDRLIAYCLTSSQDFKLKFRSQ